MSYAQNVWLVCDFCHDSFGHSRINTNSLRELRALASDIGWSNLRARDYCQDCTKEGKG